MEGFPLKNQEAMGRAVILTEERLPPSIGRSSTGAECGRIVCEKNGAYQLSGEITPSAPHSPGIVGRRAEEPGGGGPPPTETTELTLEHLASVGALMGSVIHDLRNPINVIKTSNYFLQTRLAGEDPRLLRHLELINKACAGAVAVMEDLAEYGRAYGPKCERQLIQPIVRAAVAHCRSGSGRIQCRIDEDIPPAPMDAAQMTLAIRKLLDRSIDRSPEGSPVYLTARQAPDGLEVVVEDSGPAMHEQQRVTLFEPLIGPTGVRSSNLPAALVAEIIHRHGGSVRCEDTGTEGSRVVVFIRA